MIKGSTITVVVSEVANGKLLFFQDLCSWFRHKYYGYGACWGYYGAYSYSYQSSYFLVIMLA